MEPKKDYYEVLGVDHDADAKTIKRAFLKLARKLHPDVSDAPDAEERFKEVNEAYTVLSDDQKRANYDRYGDPNGPAGFGSDYVDVSDIFGGGGFGFGDIFDSFFGGQGRGGAQTRTRGRDMGIHLRITLAEAAAGCKKTVSYERLAPCDDCGGTGVAEGGHAKTCDRCHGSGRVVEVQRTIFGQMLGYITAKGRGKFHGKLVEQLVFIPYLIPSVAFGGIYLSMFSRPQQIFGVTLIPSLYGTFALLTLVSVVKHLPFAARAGTSNMLQISGELEEAATIEGAGFFRRFVKIVFPLSKGGFISGFMLIFVSIMKELDLIILIMTPTTSTLPYLAFRYQNGNSAQASDCVAIVMFSIVFLVYAIANLSGKADLAKSMAG